MNRREALKRVGVAVPAMIVGTGLAKGEIDTGENRIWAELTYVIGSVSKTVRMSCSQPQDPADMEKAMRRLTDEVSRAWHSEN